jgi:hypothetical protein
VRYTLLILALLLAACTSRTLPFEKEGPLTGSSAELVRPPWETFVKAGPGAEKELDLETLNGPGGTFASGTTPEEPTEQQVAQNEPPPKPAKKSDKKGTVIAAVAVPPVQGNGGKELTAAMRQVLRDAGWPVINAPREDALTIRGKVTLAKPKGATQNVKLVWSVFTPDGKKLGDVNQSNDLPAGSLAKGWGDNARYATEAAAEAVAKLVQGYR